MQGLLQRLAGLDSDAERGLRLIDFFDQLLLHRADLEAVLRATAVLAEATAGAIDDRLGTAVEVKPNGYAAKSSGPSASAVVQAVVGKEDGQSTCRVWLDRSSGSAQWDDLIVARMALTVATVNDRAQVARPPTQLNLADPAVIEVLLRPAVDASDEAQASRAVRLLGFAHGQLVVPIALASTSGSDSAVAAIRSSLSLKTGRHVVGTSLSENLAVLLVAAGNIPTPDLPPGVFACVGEAVAVNQCATAWVAARRGVRFSALGGRWAPWQHWANIGALSVLADVPVEAARTHPDVQAISGLAERRGGESDIQLLEAVCTSVSVREAASFLHLHHSSLAYRLDNIASSLGYDIRTAEGRYRGRTALLLWQLHQ